MYTNRKMNISRVLVFTRQPLLMFGVYAAICVALYRYFGWTWMTIPWLPISVIGTAVAFYVGFKNNSAYERTWEARKIWGAIVNTSRSWGSAVRGLIGASSQAELSDKELHALHKELVYRHIAWLYALRRRLWARKSWEHDYNVNNSFRKVLEAHFAPQSMEEEMAVFLDPKELKWVMARKNQTTQLLDKQSSRLKELHQEGLLTEFQQIALQNLLTDLYTQQGKCERIKNFPLPRQYATSSALFIFIFIALLPFGLMSAFYQVNHELIWLTVPFTMLVGWIYLLMEIVGDYAENPFEMLAFDTPTTSLCRTIEIDLREMLGEEELPEPIKPLGDIML